MPTTINELIHYLYHIFPGGRFTSTCLTELINGLKVDRILILEALSMEKIVPDNTIPKTGEGITPEFPYEWYKIA